MSKQHQLQRIGRAYFMVQSQSGKTHAINPKTEKTYCGLAITDNYHFLDTTPDDKHQPTCKICQRCYDEPIRKELQMVVNELKEQISEFLFLTLILKDVKALGRFTENIAKFMRNEHKLKDNSLQNAVD